MRVFLILFIVFGFYFIYEKQTNLIGSWAVELLKSDKNIPIYIFKLNIIEQNKRVLGEYFYILNYGNKIDFNNNFIGSWVSDNKYSIFFYSGFSWNFGLVDLILTQYSKLLWKVTKIPEKGEYLIPKIAILDKKTLTDQDDVVNQGKVFISNNPDVLSKTKPYSMELDKVTISEGEDRNKIFELDLTDEQISTEGGVIELKKGRNNCSLILNIYSELGQERYDFKFKENNLIKTSYLTYRYQNGLLVTDDDLKDLIADDNTDLDGSDMELISRKYFIGSESDHIVKKFIFYKQKIPQPILIESCN